MKNLPAGSALIIPAADMVLGMLERAELFAEQPGRVVFQQMLSYKPQSHDKLRGINRASAVELIKSYYLSLLQDCSAWASLVGNVPFIDQQLGRMVRGWDDDVNIKVQNAFYNDVLSDVFEEVHDWLNRLDDGKLSWNVWSVRVMGLDIIIEKGEDYRVLDWQRRMAAGAEYLKAVEEGESLPADAWLPDGDSRRYVELLSTQRSKPSGLGRSSCDELDRQRNALRARGSAKQRRKSTTGVL